MIDLAESRSAFVRQYRRDTRPWPDGPGAWYRHEDWADDGTLVATGEARARALDPWANVRAKGAPCPALRVESRRDAVTKRDAERDAVTPPMTPAERARAYRQRKN